MKIMVTHGCFPLRLVPTGGERFLNGRNGRNGLTLGQRPGGAVPGGTAIAGWSTIETQKKMVDLGLPIGNHHKSKKKMA
jgi:hypothetical protein